MQSLFEIYEILCHSHLRNQIISQYTLAMHNQDVKSKENRFPTTYLQHGDMVKIFYVIGCDKDPIKIFQTTTVNGLC